MAEYLCVNCSLSDNQCAFRVTAQGIADATDMTPIAKHSTIKELRNDARLRACPNLNDVDPNYDGRDEL